MAEVLSLPLRERGLKHTPVICCTIPSLSLPLRERGLKLDETYSNVVDSRSLPLRERGLKLNLRRWNDRERLVAPPAGAWIET